MGKKRNYECLRLETQFSENGTCWFNVFVCGVLYDCYRSGEGAGAVIDRLAELHAAGGDLIEHTREYWKVVDRG